ncbi:MAG: V-type ATP synthase subunit F [Clostridia bacterium]|nr:V-type ATP synthase subunit F [Clostridia bacterium]
MKMYVLSSRSDVLAGMRLAGIEGSLIKSGEELERFILSNPFEDVAILMITGTLAKMNTKIVDEMKKKDVPLVIEIPDGKVDPDEEDPVTRYVREAMGIKI